MQFNLKSANRYLPYIFLIGIGIGTANYIMNGDLNWIQWVIQSLLNSFLIGYSLVIIASNKNWLKSYFSPSWKLYCVLFLAFFSIGVLATEIEQIMRMVIFSLAKYQFLSAGKMYLFNGIISLVLGFSFFLNEHFFPTEPTDLELSQNELSNEEIESEQTSEPISVLLKLPVKQGKSINLIPIQDIAYLEAFDNYCFAFDRKGEKRLCDYSLLFLQERLGENFLRIHRKYIVNTNHIKQIKPESNARYLILFDAAGLSPIISSKGYAAIIRTLIKLK